jgi:hypothetical protein
MRRARGYVLVASLVLSTTLGVPAALSGINAPVATAALNALVETGAAQQTNIAEILAEAKGSEVGIETVHDVGNAREDTSSSLILGTISTRDAVDSDVNVDARLVTDPVLVIAGSFRDTGEDAFAPGDSAQRGTTVADGVTVDD